MKNERVQIRVQTYNIVVTQFDDGSSHMERINDGFNAVELIGLGELISMDVRMQMKGLITPTTIYRNVVADPIRSPQTTEPCGS